MRQLSTALAALVLATAGLTACARSAGTRSAQDPFGSIPSDYVRLILHIGAHEEGYVDAYYGPPEWAEEARARPRSLDELAAEADRLIAAVTAIDEAALDPLSRRRRRFLEGHLRAARARIDYIRGTRLQFRDEARAFFGVDIELRPLSSYEPVLEQLEALVSGDGPLGERINAFRDRYAVPTDRIDEVVNAAIAECRRRTLQHIQLPAGEAFTAEMVTGKPWRGYNWYKGDAHSVIQVNTDGTSSISGAVPLGCHEGYPGHHTHNVLMEERLVEGRGFVELSVLPLYSPMAIIAEGSGNYGVDLAFPDEERLAFEAEVLYPLAGLDPATAPALRELERAVEDLRGVAVTIAADYVDGRIDRERALELLESHALSSPTRAAQRISFIDAYRSYTVNYWIGEELVRAYVERAAPDPDGRWRALESILAQPTVPADLQ